MPQIGYAHRPVALGQEGMVASAHPFATLTGIEVLKSGGSVADAAVAINAVLAVTQPNACGLGGDFFCLFYESATRKVHFLNGAGRSGSRATLEELLRRGLDQVPMEGPLSVSVPGCVDAWGRLHQRFGRLRWEQLFDPAIHYAENGFPMTQLVSQATAERLAVLDDPEWRRIFVPQGRVPQTGEILRQPELARTLSIISREGPEAFYRGPLAARISERLADGFVTRDDLARHAGEWGKPLAISYRGYTLYETPPPTQGIAALLAMNLVEGFPLPTIPYHSVDHLHLSVEMVKLAFADRDRFLADPAHFRVPMSGLLDKRYAGERRKEFNPRKAQWYGFGNPGGDTTGFVVADRDGNMISVIESLYGPFGSGVVPEGTGIVLQSRGAYFSTDPTHPNVLAPGKQPFHTLIAAIVTRDNAPLMGFATRGADGQPQFHLQVLTNVLDYRMEIQEAIERPRFLLGPFELGEAKDTLRIEGRVEAEVIQELRARGHQVVVESDWYNQVGTAHGIVIKAGTLMGGADPRGDGVALGY
jgi:gamma-glutamyltranspeptidase/glutathione hydrolase